MLKKISYTLLLAAALVALDGCSQQARQMRQTRKISKQNVKNKEKKSVAETPVGPGEVHPDDVNYKPDKIGHKCVYVNAKGKRCSRNAQRRNRYCFWHTPRHRI